MAAPVIQATGLQKSFGDTVAVSDLALDVDAGKIVALLGPNGAGKTTTIKMLTTLLPPDSGEASIAGYSIGRESRFVRRFIGLAGQTAAVDEKLTARENLTLFGRLYKIPKAELSRRVEELIDQFQMGDYADRPAETYSGGQRRRLDVVAALIAEPPAVFLDEPTTGLDPRSRAEIWDAISDLAASGTAIVLTTQYLEEADRLADEIIIIDGGSEIARGTPDDLKSSLDQDVLEIHFTDDAAFEQGRLLLADETQAIADPAARLIQVPVAGPRGASLAMLRRLDEAEVSLADFQLRRPTLDDVFLTLTSDEEERR